MTRGRSRRRRWIAIAAGSAALLVVAAVVVRQVVLRDSSRPVSVDDALDRYRDSTTTVPGTSPATTAPPGTGSSAATTSPAATTAPVTTGAPTAAAPGAGIYRYTTTGHESIDALGGARHDYPAETTITVTPEGCGVLLRWDALVERRDEWHLCPTPDGIVLDPSGRQYHQFFGQSEDEPVVCSGTFLLVPSDMSAGSAETLSCSLAGDPWAPAWQRLERAVRTVGGSTIDVLHVRMTVVDGGEFGEHTTIDWFVTSGGLPVEVRCTKDSRSPSPVGPVTYHEEYSLVLESLEPLR